MKGVFGVFRSCFSTSCLAQGLCGSGGGLAEPEVGVQECACPADTRQGPWLRRTGHFPDLPALVEAGYTAARNDDGGSVCWVAHRWRAATPAVAESRFLRPPARELRRHRVGRGGKG